MTDLQFISQAKTWLSHKLILSEKSHWYKLPDKAKAIQCIRATFGRFVIEPRTFSVQTLAQRIINNEDLLYVILPIPGNPAYEKSSELLSQLIQHSKQLLNL